MIALAIIGSTLFAIGADMSVELSKAEPKIIAKVQGRLANVDNEAVFQSKADFEKAGGDLKAAAQKLKVDAINFDKHTIIIIGVGTRPTGGYQIDVTDLISKEGKLTVKWKEQKPDGIVIQVLTKPAVSVLIEKVTVKIEFDPKTPPKAKDDE